MFLQIHILSLVHQLRSLNPKCFTTEKLWCAELMMNWRASRQIPPRTKSPLQNQRVSADKFPDGRIAPTQNPGTGICPGGICLLRHWTWENLSAMLLNLGEFVLRGTQLGGTSRFFSLCAQCAKEQNLQVIRIFFVFTNGTFLRIIMALVMMVEWCAHLFLCLGPLFRPLGVPKGSLEAPKIP